MLFVGTVVLFTDASKDKKSSGTKAGLGKSTAITGQMIDEILRRSGKGEGKKGLTMFGVTLPCWWTGDCPTNGRMSYYNG